MIGRRRKGKQIKAKIKEKSVAKSKLTEMIRKEDIGGNRKQKTIKVIEKEI